ncbi:MAG: AzlD domain-containing protein [Acidimicrobiales bacterium]|nr:AzlD domain-containing protein [Acidimicrobiales bacterium]
MSTTVIVLAGLSVGTYALKAAGPLLLGGRRLPPVIETISDRIPAALLAALVVVSAVGGDGEVVLDERVFGVVAAAIALRFRVAFVAVVVVAVATTAATRAIL